VFNRVHALTEVVGVFVRFSFAMQWHAIDNAMKIAAMHHSYESFERSEIAREKEILIR
jgi:translation elongation factor EF-Ts